jgi:peptidoglycan/LPS O-acetylase OafA/YrhL
MDSRRQRYRVATLVCCGFALCVFVAMLFAPRSERFPIVLIVVTPLAVAAIVLGVLAQPTRVESGQGDLSHPSPRGRAGIAFLVFTVLFVVLTAIQHRA